MRSASGLIKQQYGYRLFLTWLLSLPWSYLLEKVKDCRE
jgi:hypothetical protein